MSLILSGVNSSLTACLQSYMVIKKQKRLSSAHIETLQHQHEIFHGCSHAYDKSHLDPGVRIGPLLQLQVLRSEQLFVHHFKQLQLCTFPNNFNWLQLTRPLLYRCVAKHKSKFTASQPGLSCETLYNKIKINLFFCLLDTNQPNKIRNQKRHCFITRIVVQSYESYFPY